MQVQQFDALRVPTTLTVFWLGFSRATINVAHSASAVVLLVPAIAVVRPVALYSKFDWRRRVDGTTSCEDVPGLHCHKRLEVVISGCNCSELGTRERID